MISHILCPIDFSEFSSHALAHAAAMARWYEARVTVLHVYSAPHPPLAATGYPGGYALLPAVQPDEVRERVRRFCERLVPPDLPLTVAVEEGDPVAAIARTLDEVAVDLLIMGTHGRGGVQRLLLGSVTEKVIRTVRCPVLTIPPPAATPTTEPTFKTILCPIDFGPSAIRALEYAFSLAREADARLILQHVVEADAHLAALGDAAGLVGPDFQASLERDAAEKLAELMPAAAGSWCRPEASVVAGSASREILRTAEASAAELIVMGVQGRAAIDLLLFGSTAHHIIREAQCPVLTVRATDSTS